MKNFFKSILTKISAASLLMTGIVYAQVTTNPSVTGVGASSTAATFTSTAATGTPPMIVSSTTLVTNFAAQTAVTATTCGNATNLGGVAAAGFSIIPPSSVFSALPGAGTVTAYQPYVVTDVGTVGSMWYSNGSAWSPFNGMVKVSHIAYPFVYPSSGSITTVTGALLLTTALDATYANSYMYFPAGAWTGSAAGWYYVQMSSTTAGLVYSNSYSSGIPSTPGSPALVTTGLGAYVQTTGSYINGPTISIQGNLIGANGKLEVEFDTTNNNTASAKATKLIYGGQSLAGVNKSTNVGDATKNMIINRGVTGVQSTITTGLATGLNAFLTVDSTANQNLVEAVFQTAATDYIVLHSFDVVLYR